MYDVALIGSSRQPLLTATGSAKLQDFVEVLPVMLNLADLAPGPYELRIRRAQTPWNAFPILLEELFRRRIAEPIGMSREQWNWGDWGQVDGVVVNGGSGNNGKQLNLSAREAARFGLLFLNRGHWNGKQLVSERWVDEATRVQVSGTVPHGFAERSSEGPGEYGFNWWVNGVKPNGQRKFPGAPSHTFCGAGHNNNRCFIIPEWNMVIVRLGLDGSAGDRVWDAFLAKVGESLIP